MERREELTRSMSISVTELGVGTDEELMDQLIGPGGPKVKDRKYRLRTYKECFLGKELVTWLVQNCEEASGDRKRAAAIAQRLMNQNYIAHVCFDHQFKDASLFYRFQPFRSNQVGVKSAVQIQMQGIDATWESVREDCNGVPFDIKAIAFRMLSDTEPMSVEIKNRTWRMKKYKSCFICTEAVDWMERNLAIDRPSAVMLGRRMQTRNIIDHVTSDREFADGHFFFKVKELPNAEDRGRIFGVPLDDLVERQKATVRQLELPYFIHMILCRLRQEELLRTEGLFRISPRHDAIVRFEALISCRMDFGFFALVFIQEEEHASDRVHLYAEVLKKFLRELPVPLLAPTDELAEQWDALCNAEIVDDDAFISRVLDILDSTPARSYALFMRVAGLFVETAEREDFNKMSLDSLARILAPSVLRSDQTNYRAVAKGIESVRRILELYQRLVENQATESETE